MNKLWNEHVTRLNAIHDVRPRPLPQRAALLHDDESEWTAAPLGRLGRRLLVDIERYLDFFAIARS